MLLSMDSKTYPGSLGIGRWLDTFMTRDAQLIAEAYKNIKEQQLTPA